MAHFGSLAEHTFGADVDDIRGNALYGVNDEKLGKIDDVIFDHSSGEIRSVVVDTGGWLSSKKFLVPAARIHAYEKDRDAFQVDLTKQDIERFPAYDEKHMRSEKDWTDYEDRYSKAWSDGEVLHKQGSNRSITPEPEEARNTGAPETRETRDTGSGWPVQRQQSTFPPGGFGSMGEEIQPFNEPVEPRTESASPQRLVDKFTDTANGPSKLNMHPSGAREEASSQQYAVGNQNLPGQQANPSEQSRIGDVLDFRGEGRGQGSLFNRGETEGRSERLDRFEQLLRQNRVDITAKCGACGRVKDKAA